MNLHLSGAPSPQQHHEVDEATSAGCGLHWKLFPRLSGRLRTPTWRYCQMHARFTVKWMQDFPEGEGYNKD